MQRTVDHTAGWRLAVSKHEDGATEDGPWLQIRRKNKLEILHKVPMQLLEVHRLAYHESLLKYSIPFHFVNKPFTYVSDLSPTTYL